MAYSVDLNEKANFTRISRLLVDKGTKALRITFDGIHPPAKLLAVLKSKKKSLLKLKPGVINNLQWDLLFPPSGCPPSSKTFDVTLLTVLLRNICTLPAPATGWNKMPPCTDNSLQANITRIKLLRNEFYAHASSTQLDKTTFENLWQEISKALVCLKIPKQEIDDLKSSFLGPEEKHYLSILSEWVSKDKDVSTEVLENLTTIEKQVAQSNLQQQSLQRSFQQLQDLAEENRGGIQKLCQSNLRQQSESEKVLLQKLAKHNFQSKIKRNVQLFHPDTRKWLIKRVEDWFTTEDESRCLFIKAGPGFGKSVFAAKVCELFKGDGKLAACHFCDFRNSNLKDPKIMLQSLASHMCVNVPGFKEKLLDQLSRPHTADSLNGAFQIYLQNPLDELEVEPSLIVIDGLDESATDDKSGIVKLISDYFPALPMCVKVLVTSRPELSLEKLEHIQMIEIDVNNEENRSDLCKYLKDCLPSLAVGDVPNPWAQNQHEEPGINCSALPAIVKRCEGSFLFASHVQHELRKRKDLERMRVEEIMLFLPKGMRSVYKNYFHRLEMELKAIIKKEPDLCGLLELLVAANKSLPLRFIARSLGLGLDCRKTIKIISKVNESVSSLLNVSSDEVTVFHKSMYDWLLTSGEDTHEYSVKLDDGKKSLWLLCEQIFQEIKMVVMSGGEPNLTYEVKYALDYGYIYLKHCKIKDSFYWLVDIIIIHVSLSYYPKNTGVLPFLWQDVLLGNEDFSLQLRQRISWHLTEFSSIDIALRMDPTSCFYLENVIHHSPKGCFTDEERKTAEMILGKFPSYVRRYSVAMKCLKPLLVKPFSGTITAVGVSSSMKLAAVAMADGTLCVFSLPELAKLFHHSTGSEHICCCTFAPEDLFVLYGKLETALSIAHKKEVSFFHGKEERFKSCAFCPNGKRLVTNNYSRIVKVWDVVKQSLLWSLCADVSLECCFFSKTGLFIIGDTKDAVKDSYCVWNSITFQRVDLRGTFAGSVRTDDRRRRSEKCSRCCGQAQRELIRCRRLGNSTGMYNDMDCIFYLHEQQSLHVIESVHLTALAAWGLFIRNFGASPVDNITMIENNLWLSCDREKLVVFISEPPIETQSCLSSPTSVLWCTFSPDGARLASCTSDGLVNMWNVDNCRIYQRFESNVGTWLAACWWSDTYLFVCYFNDEMPSLSKYPVDENFMIMVSQIVPVSLCAFVNESPAFSSILDFSEGYISFACGETKPVKVLEVSKTDHPENVVLPGIRSMMNIAVSPGASVIIGTDHHCSVWKRNEANPLEYSNVCSFFLPPTSYFCQWCFSDDSRFAFSFLPAIHNFLVFDVDKCLFVAESGCRDGFIPDSHCVPANVFCTNRLLVVVLSKLIQIFDCKSRKFLGLSFQQYLANFSAMRSKLSPRGTVLAVPGLTGDMDFFRISHAEY